MGFSKDHIKSLFTRKSNKKQPNSSTTTTNSSANLNSPTTLAPSTSVTNRAHIAELEQVFKKFDVNGDGRISASELGSIMGSLGHPANEEELQSMIKEVDKDGDGFIDLKEFIELNTKGVDSDEVLENLKDAFSVYDIDGNGSISAEELHEVLLSLGDECSIAECRKMISGVDCDGDGSISFEEFKLMMMKGSRFDLSDSQRFNVKSG